MFVDTFLKVSVGGIGLKVLAATYADWVLGKGDERTAFPDRLRKGVFREWTVERVLAGEPLIGKNGCRVDMRLDSTRMLLRFVHRDTTHGAILWNSSARVLCQENRLLVEHAVGRDSPRDYVLDPVAAPPRIITSLLDKNGVDIQPRQLALPLVRLNEGDVRGFVEHELLNPQRTVPVVLVSCGPADGPPAVDPRRLSLKLRGLAVVTYLASAKATYEFTDVLAKHGLGPELRCYNGAVHSYGPTDAIQRDHRLWLAASIMDIRETDRVDRVAGLLSHRLGSRSLPSGFFQQIEEYDREERRHLAEQLSHRPSSRSHPGSASIPSLDVAAAEKERDDLRDELSASLQREKEYAEAWGKADEERRASEAMRENAEAQLEQERLVSSELRDTLHRIKQTSTTEITKAEERAIRSIIAGKCGPRDCLTVTGLLYRDRVVVLESAFNSADKAAEFRHGRKLFDLLCKLSGEYIDALLQGNGDVEAGKVFGEAFAATEAETTKKNRRAIKERTFKYNGSAIVMWPHLKIGVKESVAETIRVHFEWVAEEKKIVIGWCGEHRYRV